MFYSKFYRVMPRESSLLCFSTQYFTMKILLLISFTLAAVSSTRCTNSNETLAHDITTLLNKMNNSFFIPSITSLYRTLSNITIAGMDNFDSHSFAENSGHAVSTLTIKDIRGTTDLDYGNEIIFPLHFDVDHISITVDQKRECINVTAHNYIVIEGKMNVALTEYQSKWVMEGIQLAIASSIMPSMKHYRNSNIPNNSFEEHPIVKLFTKLSQQFDGSTIQKLYDTWNMTIPESFKAESSIQIESFNYNISIDAKPRTKLQPYPRFFQCYLYSSLEIRFKMISWFGKISLFNTTYEFDDLHFLMENVSVQLVKQDNSNDFEVEFSPPLEDDVVELLPNPHNFADHERSQIVQETQQLMISLIEKIVTLFAEPLLSLPLDYCTAPVKIFDDFLPFYADHELPFRIPDGLVPKVFLTTNINNVIITEWSPEAYVWINQNLVNGSTVLSTDVLLDLSMAEVEMNLEDRPFDKLHVTLTNLRIQNNTNDGQILVDYDWDQYDPFQNYASRKNETENDHLTFREMFSIQQLLPHILSECFNNLTSLVS
ncbi:uncharacterized protein LOC135837331 [Planococcus citri]|uniref:uncharacterized protein LOC135837331 n=1 Tax=Planococcus citri TaxID=170843 RepID=UPI0031F8F4FF